MLQEAWLELFHNDQYVVASYGYVKGYYADSGNSVVLHLKNGIPSRLRPDEVLTSDCMEIMTSFTQRFAGLFWLLLSMESEVVRRFD